MSGNKQTRLTRQEGEITSECNFIFFRNKFKFLPKGILFSFGRNLSYIRMQNNMEKLIYDYNVSPCYLQVNNRKTKQTFFQVYFHTAVIYLIIFIL